MQSETSSCRLIYRYTSIYISLFKLIVSSYQHFRTWCKRSLILDSLLWISPYPVTQPLNFAHNLMSSPLLVFLIADVVSLLQGEHPAPAEVPSLSGVVSQQVSLYLQTPELLWQGAWQAKNSLFKVAFYSFCSCGLEEYAAYMRVLTSFSVTDVDISVYLPCCLLDKRPLVLCFFCTGLSDAFAALEIWNAT